MSHSESLWECPECGETQIVTYGDISLAGAPICPECGEDMVVVSEQWIEEEI